MEKFKWKPKPAIGNDLFRQPVIILDSGQSVDESVFLQYFRKWLFDSIVARSANDRLPPHVHLKYPTSNLYARYGVKGAETWEGDRWEIGTLRIPGKPLYPWGMMETFAKFEDGCQFGESGVHPPPWRRQRRFGGQANRSMKGAGKRRGIPIYLNPTFRDCEYLRRHKEEWGSYYRCPKIMLGYTTPLGIPKGILEHTRSFYCLNRPDTDRIRDSTQAYKAYEIPTKRFRNYMGGITDKCVSIAPNWRNKKRQRKPWAAHWIREDFPGIRVKEQTRDATWEELLDATNCSIYVILSECETIPFDAYLAAARGAIIVAPNTELFSNIAVFRNAKGKKWLYPVRDYGHNRYGWSHTEVRHWLLPRIKAWQLGQIRSLRTTQQLKKS